MAGFLAAAGLISGAASAAGHGLADSHERAGDVGGADVIFQTATADNVFCLEHHCGFHFRRVADIARGGIERAHELEHADTEAGGINPDVFNVIFFGEFADGFRLSGKVHAFPLVTLKYSEFATGLGVGVFQLVRSFYPAARDIRYTPEMKTAMVLKAKDVIRRGCLEYDVSATDITSSFMAIRKTMTSSGRSATYEASRSEEASHADLAWATMHALLNEPLTAGISTPLTSTILEFY
ncbi:hypothetical protein AWG37_02345 [Escherichia coli]|nr:hypothetical protein AWG37_02345 [Escherichia coli]